MKSSFLVLMALSVAWFGPQSRKVFSGSCVDRLSGAIPAATAQAKGPLRYRLVTEYNLLTPDGAEAGTHVVTGEFTIAAENLRWTSVTVGRSSGHGKSPESVEHQRFAEGFSYARADSSKTTQPDFYRGFPPDSIDEKNLIWDELMFHTFASKDLEKLRLNEPFRMQSGDVQLAGAGTFSNRQIELTWTGIGRRNGEECVLIHDEALLNPIQMNPGAMTMKARSDYFGDIWVSTRTHRIEYGTLLEEVAGTLTGVPGTQGPQPLHVLRLATLAHLP